MIAGFKGDDGGVNPVRQPKPGRLGECPGFGVGFTGAMVGGYSENVAAGIQQGATDGRIRVGSALMLPGGHKGPGESCQLALPKCRLPLAV